MTDTSSPRRIACARCGDVFECRLGGGCWCADESFHLPVPDDGSEDCLCPACLRKAAENRVQGTALSGRTTG